MPNCPIDTLDMDIFAQQISDENRASTESNEAPVPLIMPVAMSGPRVNPAYFSDVFVVLAAPQTLQQKFPNADTLIIFDLPPAADRMICQGGWFPLKLRLPYDSVKLRESGLDLLPKLLDNERYQKRQRKNLDRAGEAIDEQYKYLLDLGPSGDEELRGEQLSALTLPEGVIRWSLMADYLETSFSVAGGHDDCCCCAEFPPNNGANSNVRDSLDFWETPLQKFRQIDDYSEVRHIATVIRLLLALTGMPLNLNSAARVYTVAGLAKMFEIRPGQVFEDDVSALFADQLRADIYDWFSQQTMIIEMLPEITFVIGHNTKVPTITQTAYRILVAEEAILSEADAGPMGRRMRPTHSPFGRKLGDLDDDIMTVLQHATKSFKERITSMQTLITTEDFLEETLKLKEYKKLVKFGKWIDMAMAQTPGSSYLGTLKGAHSSLKIAIDKSFISRVKNVAPHTMLQDPLQSALTSNHALKNHQTLLFRPIYDSLNKTQKLMTAAYWRNIANLAPLPRVWIGARSDTMHTAYSNAWKEGLIPEFRPDIDVDNFEVAFAMGKLQEVHLDPRFDKDSDLAPDATLERAFKYDTLAFAVRKEVYDFVQPMYLQDELEVEVPFRLPLSTYLLLGLKSEELRFLPLWAGGNDDGTGGVFAEKVPVAEFGAAAVGPGPAFRTGATVGTEASFDMVSGKETDSGIGSSRVVQDGASTVYARGRVVAMDALNEVEEDFEGVEMGESGFALSEDGLDDEEDEGTIGDVGAIGYVAFALETEESGKIKEDDPFGLGTDSDDNDDYGNENDDKDDDDDFGNEYDDLHDDVFGITAEIAKVAVSSKRAAGSIDATDESDELDADMFGITAEIAKVLVGEKKKNEKKAGGAGDDSGTGKSNVLDPDIAARIRATVAVATKMGLGQSKPGSKPETGSSDDDFSFV